MLSNINRTVNLSATSTFGDKTALFMNANIRSGETPTVNLAYKDMDTYKENKEAADADFTEFQAKAIAASEES